MSTRTAKVTSITARRAAERKRSEQSVANARAATTLFAVVAALLVIGVTATISASSAVATWPARSSCSAALLRSPARR